MTWETTSERNVTKELLVQNDVKIVRKKKKKPMNSPARPTAKKVVTAKVKESLALLVSTTEIVVEAEMTIFGSG